MNSIKKFLIKKEKECLRLKNSITYDAYNDVYTLVQLKRQTEHLKFSQMSVCLYS